MMVRYLDIYTTVCFKIIFKALILIKKKIMSSYNADVSIYFYKRAGESRQMANG